MVMVIYSIGFLLIYIVSCLGGRKEKLIPQRSLLHYNPHELHTFPTKQTFGETYFPSSVLYWNFWRKNRNDFQITRKSDILENTKSVVTSHPTDTYSTNYVIKRRQDFKYASTKSSRFSLPKFKVTPVACAYGMCICTHLYAVCSDRGKQLSYIPRLPTTITNLYFYNNYLPLLNSSTFNNVTDLHLEYLFLANNSVNNCGPNVFNNLVHLKTLDIEDERRVIDLKKCIMGLYTIQLVELTFISLVIQEFTTDIFSNMNGSSVKEILIDQIDIWNYNQHTFSVFKNLTSLRMNYCKIKKTNLIFSDTMTHVDLIQNSIPSFPKFCSHFGQAIFPNLVELRLDSNLIRMMSRHDIDCLQNLQLISVSNNPLLSLESNVFSGLPLLTTVNLDSINYYFFEIKRFAFNSSSLKTLLLRYNSVSFTWLHVDIFEYCPMLEILNMEGTTVPGNCTDDYISRILSPLKNLKILALCFTEISFLPSAIPMHMNKLKVLYMNQNNIAGWQEGYFTSCVSLERLYLHKNRIATVNRSSFPENVLKRLKVLALGFNPFACSCELLWFKTMLDKYKHVIRFPFYPDNYECDSPPSIQGELLIHTKLSDKFCILSRQISIIIMSTSSVVLILLFCASLVYRYRWNLRFAVYMIRFLGRRYNQRLENEDDNPIDVYLSCSESDLDFVLDEIVYKLEMEHNLRIFIPERDGIGNKIDGIIANMDASRKAILCVSNKYACDNYCEFEASLALDRCITEKRDIIIVILLEEIDALNVNKTLHKIINKCDYIYWARNEDGGRLFWIKLLQSINNRDDIVAYTFSL